MRRVLLLTCLIWPITAGIAAASELNVRAVQSQSTDVFGILSVLSSAEKALARRDYMAAKEGFENVLLHDPNLETAQAGLRRSLIALGDIKTASTYMTDPSSTDGIIIRSLMGEFPNAEQVIKSKLIDTPDPRLWILLGHLQDQNQQPSKAKMSYSMAALSGARSGLAENNIGQSYWLEGNHEAALTSFQKAVDLDPSDTQFDNNRRRALITLGDTHEAIAGLNSERAGLFLAYAGDQALTEGETRLARYLYKKSLDLSPRYNPHVAQKIAQLDQ